MPDSITLPLQDSSAAQVDAVGAHEATQPELTIVLYELPAIVAQTLAQALSFLAPQWQVISATRIEHPAAVVIHDSTTAAPPDHHGYIITLFAAHETAGLDNKRRYWVKKPLYILQLNKLLQGIAMETGVCGRGKLRAFHLKSREKCLWRQADSQAVSLLEDDSVALTDQEMVLMGYLLRVGEEGTSRNALLRDVWGYAADVETLTIETHMSRLRQKIARVGLKLIFAHGEYRLDIDD